jgi:hypothetical protein
MSGSPVKRASRRQIPFVRDHLELILMGIVAVSVVSAAGAASAYAVNVPRICGAFLPSSGSRRKGNTMRRIITAVAASALAAGGMLFSTTGPAAASACSKLRESSTKYGEVQGNVWFDCDKPSNELQYDLYAEVPIKSKSYVRFFYANGTSSGELKYTSNDGGGQSGPGTFNWHYWNPNNHSSVVKVEFHTFVGPDSDVVGVLQTVTP